jgi:hypothetical protein
MFAFDPATVRKAVDEFTPRRPEKFWDLMPAKDVIIELRQKRASYPTTAFNSISASHLSASSRTKADLASNVHVSEQSVGTTKRGQTAAYPIRHTGRER